MPFNFFPLRKQFHTSDQLIAFLCTFLGALGRTPHNIEDVQALWLLQQYSILFFIPILTYLIPFLPFHQLRSTELMFSID